MCLQPDEDKPASPSASPMMPATPKETTSEILHDSPIIGTPGTPIPSAIVSGSPGSPGTPTSPSVGGPPLTAWRPGHGRRTSLGTTKTSPSTRRRSLENTMHLIRDVVGGKDAQGDGQLERLAEVISSPTKGGQDERE